MNKFAIGAVLASAVLLTGCAGGATSSTSSSVGEAPKVATLGSTLSDKFHVAVTLTSLRYAAKNDLGTAPSNGKYIVAGFSIENGSTDDLAVSSLMSFELTSDSGQKGDPEIFIKGKGGLNSTIKPGRKLTGEVAFNVAPDSKYFITFKPSPFQDGLEFEFASNQIK